MIFWKSVLKVLGVEEFFKGCVFYFFKNHFSNKIAPRRRSPALPSAQKTVLKIGPGKIWANVFGGFYVPNLEKMSLPKSLFGGLNEKCPNLGRRMRYNRIECRRCVIGHPRERNAKFGAF